ncbi:molybdopterin cofactor-binding domain-containing protein, partial [Streptomyces sp. NPDC051162]
MAGTAGTAEGAATATSVASSALSGGPAEPPPHGLGVSLPAADADAKTQGTYPYAADLWAEGLLWAAVLRSPHPHARILSIDTAEAARMPGVRAVVTHKDVPGDAAHGRRVADRPVFASDLVRHHGEPIAAVAADHPDTARLAAAAIAVEYEPLEPVTDPEQAFSAEPLHPDGNLIRHIPLSFGDPEATGEVVVEGLYRIGRQDPAPIGAEAGLAVPRPDGGVEIYTASTDPHADRDLAAACFGLEPERVKVVVTGVPGAMGDREDPGMQLPLGLLALRTGHPVKLAATREESFLSHPHRHP